MVSLEPYALVQYFPTDACVNEYCFRLIPMRSIPYDVVEAMKDLNGQVKENVESKVVDAFLERCGVPWQEGAIEIPEGGAVVLLCQFFA